MSTCDINDCNINDCDINVGELISVLMSVELMTMIKKLTL
jgi:hypothetical protein